MKDLLNMGINTKTSQQQLMQCSRYCCCWCYEFEDADFLTHCLKILPKIS